MQKSSNFDWPGWPLYDNPFAHEFDLTARKRMIKGSQKLLPILKKYKNQMGKTVLEVGPFFNALVTPKRFPNTVIVYWENDRHVLEWFAKKENGKTVYPLYCDLNNIEGESLIKLKKQTQQIFEQLNRKQIAFDSVVISHVFNYIDYKLFLVVLKDFLKEGALVFLNNVIEYGLPPFFSKKRPLNNNEIFQTFQEMGYEIIEKKFFPSPKKNMKNKRLILVARNIQNADNY